MSNIQSATSGIYKVIGDKARSAPDLIFTDTKFMSKLTTGRYAYHYVCMFYVIKFKPQRAARYFGYSNLFSLFQQPRTFCIFFIAEQFKKDGRCRFKLSKISNAPSHSYFHLPMKKGSPFTHIVSRGYIICLVIDAYRSVPRYWILEVGLYHILNFWILEI